MIKIKRHPFRFYFYGNLYVNTWELKSFLEKKVIDQEEYTPPPKRTRIDSSVLEFEQMNKFSGAPLKTLRGIMLWSFTGILLFFGIPDAASQSIGFGAMICILAVGWWLFHSWFMYFFEVGRDYLVIKNHGMFWKKDIYRLADIREIVFESTINMPNCLRVITNVYREKLYPAEILKDETWLELQKKLEQKGIPVRNECIF